MLKVLIATGGTGGHLFPSQQLAQLLQDTNLLFAGHKLGASPFFDRTVPYREIASASTKKKWPLLLKGVFQSLRLLFQFKPDVVVGFGSFHSFPILFAALILRKKIVLFEANASLGKVNRFFAPFAKAVAFQFPISHKRAVYVPLLPWIARPVKAGKYVRDPERITILVFGGSQGASFINETFCKAARLLTFPFRVIHFTGKEDPSISYSVPSVVKPFEEDMRAAYEVSDLVVCRCGAGTSAELIQHRLPAVLIPYPYAHDHQKKNGEFLKEGARILLQKEASASRLAEEITKLKMNLEHHRKVLREISLPETTGFDEIVRKIGGRL